MFAHQSHPLPENLLPDDVADLLSRLGHRVDRRNVTRALEGAGIPGVVPPASRAERWTIPLTTLLDVVAAVLQRRELRSAGPGRRVLPSLEKFRLSAARLLMREPALAKHVELKLRRRVTAEIRLQEEAAQERAATRMAEAERQRRAAIRMERADRQRRENFAMGELYFEARLRATAARFPTIDKLALESAAFTAFMHEWPYPGDRPSWWLPPPGALVSAVDRQRDWLDGKTRERPDLAPLIPAIDFTEPWPWRREAADAP